MNENLISELEKSQFGKNKYYLEIIKEFISDYESSRANINDDLITVTANDKAGSRNIEFTINELDRLVIKVNRTMDLIKFQDVIVYDNQGIMMERCNTQAELKKDVNEKFGDQPNILAEEFKTLGVNPSIYTNQIFKNIRYKKVTRPDNFGLIGFYTSKEVSYDEKGLMKGKVIEGTFNVLKSNSISTLEFPNLEDIVVTKENEMNDNESEAIYPNSRSL